MANTSSFTPDGTRYVVRNVHLVDRADAYLWNDQMFLQMDQRGRCQAWYLQPNLTSYAGPLRCFYVRDEQTGEFWSVPFEPVRADPEEFEFSIGRGDLTWRVVKSGIEVSLRVVIPRHDVAELWTASVRNLSARPRQLSLYSYFPLESARAMAWEAKFDPVLGGMNYHAFPYYVKVEDYYKLRALKNETMCVPDVAPTAWEMSAGDFAGEGGLAAPAALGRRRLANGYEKQEPCVCAFQWARTLKPQQQFTVNLVLAPTHDRPEMLRLKRKYLSPGAIDKALAQVNAFYARHAPAYRVDTPDADFNAYLNVWLPFQNLMNGRALRFNMDACGRNIIQDSMGIVLNDPASARRNFLVTWSQQEADGWLPHSVKMVPEAETSPINTIPHRDMNVWGPYTLYYYLVETGDMSVLEERLPFVNPGGSGVSPVSSGNKERSFGSTGETPVRPAAVEEATLYEHINRGLEWLLADRTKRGLSRIGEGDWNDPLNMAGWRNKGESVWLTQALAYALDVWAEVAERVGDTPRAVRYRKEAEKCRRAVNQYAWDRAWYMRGTTDAGRRFGVKGDKEGAIFINSQSWAIICGAATGARIDTLMESIERYLMTPSGPMTLAPPFTRMYEDIGKICLKQGGTGENGSVYCHAATFLAYALYQARRSEAGWRILRTLLTGWGTNPLSRSGQIPTYIPNQFFGTAMGKHAGKSSHSAMTGTTAWWQRTALTQVLGVRAEWEGLRMDPQLPAGWKQARVQRNFRGAGYDITINRERDAQGLRVWLDGAELPDNLVPLQAPGTRHEVRVTVGA